MANIRSVNRRHKRAVVARQARAALAAKAALEKSAPVKPAS